MKNLESTRECCETRRDLQYPADGFADATERLGVFENPDIERYYYDCLTTDFPDEIAYQQGLLTIIHAFDVDHTPMTVAKLGEVNLTDDASTFTTRELHGLGLLLADIHFNTGRFTECLCELLTIKRRLMNEGATDKELIDYATAAVHDVAVLAKPFDEHPVISSSLLAEDTEMTDICDAK